MEDQKIGDRGLDTCDRSDLNNSNLIYSTQQSRKWLTEAHRKDLQNSGLSDEQIEKTGHFSAEKSTARQLVGIRLPGLIFQYCDPFGKPYLTKDGKPFHRIKPDWGTRKTEDSPKYLSPKDEGCRPYFSRLHPQWEKILTSTKTDLWETEGEKKADCGCANGLSVIGFAGVDAWVDRCDRETSKQLDASRPLPELSVIEWKGRRVNQCFDSDIIEKPGVQAALAKRAAILREEGAIPFFIRLPNEIDGAKNGLDDFIARHGVDALHVLAKAAKPTSIKTATVESKDKQNNTGQKTCYSLILKEPDSHLKALMAWAVLKERWAYRPGIGWYGWLGTHWVLKTPDEFEADLTQFMDAQDWEKWGSGLTTSIVRELKSRLQVQDEVWSPFGKIAFANGTLDIVSGEFVSTHNPYDRITKLRPYGFNPAAGCRNWIQFIFQAMEGDEERVQLIRAIFRYAVLPRRRDCKAEIEKSFDFFGPKGTGKGTTLDVLIHLVGFENVAAISTDAFKGPEGLGQLIDKDLAIDNDASGLMSNIGNYNKVVSNEPVTVKKLYKDTCTARLGVVVIRAYNAYIEVPNGSEGLDRRLVVIPFVSKPKTIDTELSQKLEAELSGIFAWCYSMSASEMKHRILTAGKIKAVAEVSLERFEANNPEFRFLTEVFPNGKERIKAGELYEKYRDWCKDNQHDPKSTVSFPAAIKALGCKKSSRKSNGNFYYSIPPISDFDTANHLGIDQGQLRDTCGDSSNSLLEQDRDSWGQLNSKTSLQLNSAELGRGSSENFKKEKKIASEVSPTVPKTLTEEISTVLQLSLSFSTVPDVLVELETHCDRGPDNEFQIGDRIEFLRDGQWRSGVITYTPELFSDSTNQLSCWKVQPDDEEKEFYIWSLDQIRLQKDTSSNTFLSS